MKKNHIIVIVLFFTVILASIPMLSSCTQIQARNLRIEVSDVINAFINDDQEEVYEHVKNIISEENFPEKYQTIKSLLDGIDYYTLTIVNFEITVDDGIKTNAGVFGLYTNVGNFIINASTRSDMEGLASFAIAEDTDNILPPREEK